MTDSQMIQSEIDVLCDKLDRDSSHFETNRRLRDEIRAEAMHLIQKRNMLAPRRRR